MPFLVHSIAFIKLAFEGAGSRGAAEPVPGGERDHPTWPEGWQGSGQVPGEESYLYQLGCSTYNSSRRKESLDLPLCVQVICYFVQDYLKYSCLGELQEAGELGEGSSQGICYYATLWGQGGGRKVIWSIIILYFLFNIYGGHFFIACPRKCKSVCGDPISNPGCWQSTEWWAKGWDPPWQTSKMSQLTSGPSRILTNILCILINIPCILINIPSILTNILNFCQAHSDARCFLLAV